MRISLVWCLLAFVSLSLLFEVASRADDPVELDLVVSTTLNSTDEHIAKYLEALTTSVTSQLSSLDPQTYDADNKPRDGAARFRVIVEHKGTVTIGGSLQQVANGHPVVNVEVGDKSIKTTVDKAHWRTVWAMKASQKGTITFKLLQWQEKSYKSLSAWSVPVRDMLPSEGTVIVGSVEQSTAGAFDRNPKCPVTLTEAKQTALDHLLPDDLGKDLIAGLVQAKVGRTVINKKADTFPLAQEASVEVAVSNGSPWPIKNMTILVNWTEKGQMWATNWDHPFDPALKAGGNATLKHTGTAGQGLEPANRREPVRIGIVEFLAPEAKP